MTVEEIMSQLEEMGSEQTKKTFMRHGAKEPLFGVKVGDLKKLVKYVKKDQELALALYDTGNHDAMYLAGLAVDPLKLTKERLEQWVEKANWYMPAEYTVANAAAESPFALELARKWMDDDREMVAVCGWSTYAGYMSITPDEELDLQEIRGLLKRVEDTIHGERNRVRYAMNGFVIMAGSAVSDLHDEALAAADRIGKVDVNVGNTACKVPLAADYILKVKNRGKIGVKKKTCIC
ncbi:3-methyladenine DNA glycosylase AlkD [Fictibacillus solisalsi]|uniref:3-methyladenine DNA glycosylase AlkD n=1 Tax=Fictibacillus solisalsi TaxID=459525 RepID=A0A1G9XRT7_9BACL|nr:DNA alkylation repair protein [Fictibacillus solisalsi]SDM98963.1 3-methyladenine DNA glycosylase AlkD [Fictibacillus solisalsi]